MVGVGMVVGAGFMMDGVSRALKNARSLGLGKLQRDFRGRLAQAEPDREEFPCYVLCTQCRNLQPKPLPACPGCGADAWLDLSLVEMTRQLREQEEFDEADPPDWAKWVGGGVVVAAFVAGVALLIAVGTFDEITRDSVLFGVFGLPLIFGLGVFSFWIGSAAAPGVAWLIHKWMGGNDLLLRWAIPHKVVTGDLAGEVHTDAPLRSPLSDRECAAWVLTAHMRGPGERTPRLVLVEHRSAPLRIADRGFEPDRFAVEAEPRVPEGLDDAKVARVVRERGLQYSDGEFELREAIVPVGARVRLGSVQGRGDAGIPALRVGG